MTGIKQILSQTMSEIKSLFLLFFANFASWYVEYASSFITASTQIGSAIVIWLLVRFHYLNGKKLKMEIDKAKKSNE